eukprot:1307059-Pleurochrysis_carterae.AAC.1
MSETVLNSAQGGLGLKDFDVYHTNSCEYELWQNPTARHRRTLQEPMRVMHERGGADKEYWEYSMTQASLIANDRSQSRMTPSTVGEWPVN